MKRRNLALATLGITCFLLLGGRQAASQGVTKAGAGKPENDREENSSTSAHKPAFRYTVQTSDTLDVTFTLTPDFNQTVTVQPDGYISLRDAGDVFAAGKTLAELTGSIKEAYSKILHDPIISIDPKDFEKPYVLVGGQVERPGKFDWRGELTLMQAITIAGGFNDNAKHSQVLLFRRVSNEWAEAKLINVKRMLRAENLQEDVVLQPGDMVYVPKNTISKIKPYIPVPTLGVYSNEF